MRRGGSQRSVWTGKRVSRVVPEVINCLREKIFKKKLLQNDLNIFYKIAIQGTHQMAVDKEARAYLESTHIVILSVPCPFTKCNLPYLDTCIFCS